MNFVSATYLRILLVRLTLNPFSDGSTYKTHFAITQRGLWSLNFLSLLRSAAWFLLNSEYRRITKLNVTLRKSTGSIFSDSFKWKSVTHEIVRLTNLFSFPFQKKSPTSKKIDLHQKENDLPWTFTRLSLTATDWQAFL